MMGGQCSTSTSVSDQQNPDRPQPDAASNKTRSHEPSPYPRPTTHHKCLNNLYPRTDDVRRFAVPPDKVAWDVEYPDYEPVEFLAVQEFPIEEDEDFRKVKADVTWNADDGHVNRVSHQGAYGTVDGVARNPVGRTGVCGRGRLARWGPNHAADPILTRWKRNEDGVVMNNEENGRPVLQFISIKRGDSGEWAIPGGFVDSGEEVYNALQREFCEEAMDSEQWTDEEKAGLEEKLKELFTGGKEVYRGYVDDPRNTDNAWMETVAVNFHDEEGDKVGRLHLHAGDDAVGVQWKDVSSNLELYASHQDFIHKVSLLLGAHW